MQALIIVAYGAFFCAKDQGKTSAIWPGFQQEILRWQEWHPPERLEGSIDPVLLYLSPDDPRLARELQTPENFDWGCQPPSQAATLRYQTRFLR